MVIKNAMYCLVMDYGVGLLWFLSILINKIVALLIQLSQIKLVG